jgi:hypothetical protein
VDQGSRSVVDGVLRVIQAESTYSGVSHPV